MRRPWGTGRGGVENAGKNGVCEAVYRPVLVVWTHDD
jgi:hypothetical protein